MTVRISTPDGHTAEGEYVTKPGGLGVQNIEFDGFLICGPHGPDGEHIAKRYTATFHALEPEAGVVVDEQQPRYAGFSSVERAQQCAEYLNTQEGQDVGSTRLEGLVHWRSSVTGESLGVTL